MTAKILSGKDISNAILEELKAEVAELREKHGIQPGLVTILVGDDPASVSYVTGKQKTARELGFHSIQVNEKANISEGNLLNVIESYNQNPSIHGILLQVPLPKHINENKILYAVRPEKDVDGFHPENVGRLLIGEARFYPCTPYGIQQMLVRSGVEIDGAEVVVVGRSNLVGKPIAMMLMQKKKGANATVTVCHTGTKNLADHTRRADILIVAAGKVGAVTEDMVKGGAVVIDVGVNRVGITPDGKAILKGDVDFEAVKQKAAAISPVPGGVGPMTIAMLMQNTLQAMRQAVR
jgi:methylenetetrahydrofolate dehydrogenase (NADP+)/methenyltetrahydrofolate cyclohydrolase